jgi:hypothetical protein
VGWKTRRSRGEDPLCRFWSIDRPTTQSERVKDQEEDAALVVGGRRHPGSGAFTGLKSDASGKDFQVECKQTEKRSLSLKAEWLEKINREAMGRGKEPMLHMRFLSMDPDTPQDWVCVPEIVWRKLCQSQDTES